MTSRDEQFIERWRAEKSAFLLCGQFVVAKVEAAIAKEKDPAFLRIPAVPRLKDDESLLQKAFYRGKNYAEPYNDIEDKVGVRFVVLLETDVRWLGSVIEHEDECWTSVRARDHEAEIAENPYEFGYQSLHFIVRPTAGQVHLGEAVPEGLPCEIQIRTLLQHAYSEVTHDTIYKPSVRTTPEMKRAAAKSMALIEATGDYFATLDTLISEQTRPWREVNGVLQSLYEQLIGLPSTGEKSPLNELIIDRYGRTLDFDAVRLWLDEHSFISSRILERRAGNALYRLPSILLLYFRSGTAPHATPEDCPVSYSDLAVIYGDLGQSLDG